MPAVTVSITDRQRTFVEAEVQEGSYGNVSEVVRDALRLLEREKMNRVAKLRDLRLAVEEGDNSPAEPLEDDETLLKQAREYRAAKSKKSLPV